VFCPLPPPPLLLLFSPVFLGTMHTHQYRHTRMCARKAMPSRIHRGLRARMSNNNNKTLKSREKKNTTSQRDAGVTLPSSSPQRRHAATYEKKQKKNGDGEGEGTGVVLFFLVFPETRSNVAAHSCILEGGRSSRFLALFLSCTHAQEDRGAWEREVLCAAHVR
jgi:hypothetical protein